MSDACSYEPFYTFDRFLDEALGAMMRPNAHDQTTRRKSAGGVIKSIKPRMDLHEDSEKNLVTATFELPGVPKDAIQIDVQDGRLTVSAETKMSEDYSENGYAVRERQFGKLSRTLQLPRGVNDDEITASMENGVLTITFPKSTPEQAAKRVTIS